MANDKPTPGISLPRETFARLTPQAYLNAHLKANTRVNGRTSYREPSINTGSLNYSNGSAVVRLGDTAVVAGIRGEVLQAADIPNPSEDIEELGLLVVNLEMSTGCSPAHLPGNPPSSQAQSLSWRLHQLLHSNLINIDDLRIESEGTKGYWTLYLDILCISLDGNCFDAAWIAVMAALQNTKLPKAVWDADQEMILCSPLIEDSSKLNITSIPIPTTFAVYPFQGQSKTLIDPDAFEEGVCQEFVTITFQDDQILRVEKNGGHTITPSQMKESFAAVQQRATSIKNQLLSLQT